MQKIKNLFYDNLNICEYEVDDLSCIDKINEQEYDVIKLQVPSDKSDIIALSKRGYTLVERTIDVSVSLLKVDDVSSLIRFPIEESFDYKNEITFISEKSFPFDRRFHLKKDFDDSFAKLVMADWIDGLEKCLVCLFKDKPIGFLALKEQDDKSVFVHLAAVDEQYRVSGAAISLYAKAIQNAKELGYANLCGRVSTRNIAVMNLYAYFGAKFSNPVDVFIKEV